MARELMQEYERYSSSMPSVLCCSFSAVPADLLMSLSFVHSSAANVCSAPDDEGRLQFSHRSFSDRLLKRDSAFQVTAEDGHGAVCRVLDNHYPGEEE